MRVRITRRRPGEIDGVDLSSFEVGLMYDVSPSLATYLIMTESADPVLDEDAEQKIVKEGTGYPTLT